MVIIFYFIVFFSVIILYVFQEISLYLSFPIDVSHSALIAILAIVKLLLPTAKVLYELSIITPFATQRF